MLGILVGRQVLFPEGGTLVPDGPLLCKTGTVPGSGLALNAAAVSLSDYGSNYLIVKVH